MKRPSLAFGLVIFTITILLLFTGISIAVVLSLIAVAVVLFYFLTKNEKIKNLLIIPPLTLSILFSVASVSLNKLLVYEKAIEHEGNICDVVGFVTEVHPKYYTIKTLSVDSLEKEVKINFTKINETDYRLYDIIFINDAVIKKEHTKNEYSKKCFLLINDSYESEKIGEKERDLFYYIANIKYSCNEKLSYYLTGDAFGVISGMLFGGTDYISSELKTAFRSSGVAHLLAVSGLHTSLWCTLFITILKFLRVKEKYANLSGVLILVLLSVISGFTPSVIRASFMMAVTLLGPLFKKRSDGINSLGLSAGILVLINPFVVYSPSFYLSFLATLGVVLSSNYTQAFNPLLKKLKSHNIIRKTIKFVFESVLISVFATVFTLPASVYYFGTVSIISPLTNLLTVNLAFVAMSYTLLPLSISFIPVVFTEKLSEILFSVSEFLLNILTSLVKYIGSFKYSAITVYEEFIYIGFGLSLVISGLFIFTLNKTTLKPSLRRIFALSIIIPLLLSLIFSVIPFKFNAQFTIIGDTNTPNLIIRSGNHYAVINIPENLNYTDFEYLPKTNNDVIDLLAVTSLNQSNLPQYKNTIDSFNITEIMVTPFVNSLTNKMNTSHFDYAQVSGDFNYSFCNKINIRIIDTYGKNCAIIKHNNKTIVLSFSNYNDLRLIEAEAGHINILILPEKIPDNYSLSVDTLIVCSTKDNNIDKNDKKAQIYAKTFMRTSTSDNITLKFKGGE